MFIQNFKHELRLLSRNYWLLALSIIFTLLAIYAGNNGLTMHQFRVAELDNAKSEYQEDLNRLIEIANAVENGENPDDSYRLSPMNTSIATGALAIKPTDALSALAIGQSDLYTHQVKISSREDLATLSLTEMSNPVQLLFGNFDLLFVLTYLLPLIIIAFTYNLHSQELESGRLKLVASNPINPKLWLLQRFIIRLILLTFILGFAVSVTLWVLGISISTHLTMIIGLTFAYMCFWFALSFLVNILGSSSSKNAISLLTCWIVLVLIAPAVINQTANSLYPTPSRVVLLDQIRETKKELSQEQDKVLAEYLRNHPELTRNEGENRFAYWQGFFATQEMTEQALSPLIESFDSQLDAQQLWISTWRFLSPAILYKTSVTELAGTSSTHYQNFKQSVQNFTLQWRDYFTPMVFENRMLTVSDVEYLPSFNAEKNYNYSAVAINMMVVFGLSFLLLMVSFYRNRIQFHS